MNPGDPRLIDREGKRTIGTADPLTRTVHLSNRLKPPLLDRVLLHEVAHAISMSHGLLGELHQGIPDESWVRAEEWSVKLVENHGVEAVVIASEVLGRPLCIGGFCVD